MWVPHSTEDPFRGSTQGMANVSRAEFPSLFSHTRRSDWGVAIVTGEHDRKRTYLFEDGEERTLGSAGIELMLKIDKPDREQQATCSHLLSLIAKRGATRATSKAPGMPAVDRQVERFRKKYRGGFYGRDWKHDQAGVFARHVRGGLSQRAQTSLSADSVQQHLSRQDFSAIWQQATQLLAESRLVSTPPRIPEAPSDQRRVVEALSGLLHGSESYEHRFDQWVTGYASVFGDAPSWQIATALPAMMSPVDHVYVEAASFRKQLKAMARPGALGSRPSGAAYMRCLGAAQALAHLLATRGEVPMDLLDVHDFIRCTG